MDLQTVLAGKCDGGERATDLLREDHRKISELGAQYRLAVEQRSEARQSLAEEICMQLELHAQVEEDLFYPAVRSQDDALVNESIEEHRAVERDIAQIEQLTPKDPRYDHIMIRMIEAVDRHITKEESALFPLVEQRLPHILPELRKQIIRRKEQAAGSVEELEGRS